MGRKKLTIEAAREIVLRSRGARSRELTARHLLLHPEELQKATAEELGFLYDYVSRQGWRSLWHHDQPMYRLLREASRQHQSEDGEKFSPWASAQVKREIATIRECLDKIGALCKPFKWWNRRKK